MNSWIGWKKRWGNKMNELTNFNKVIFLNNYSVSEKTYLNKYSPFSYFKSAVQEKKLVFVSPKTWIDPFEQLYFAAENYQKYNFQKPDLYCMCLTENSSQNEDAAWTMYQNGSNEKIIKITYNAVAFFQSLLL